MPHRCPMAKSLTDSVVSTTRPARSQRDWKEIADGGCRGLCLRLSPRGEKVWAVRHMVSGKRKRHTLGAYPAVSLAEARRRAGDYLAGAREGMTANEIDTRARARTLSAAAAHAEYLEALTVSARTRVQKEALFADHIREVVG